MIGIDLCSADRIRRIYDRHGTRFTERVYTPSEIAYAMRRRDPWPHLAARWAAKEAVFKVLGRVPGFRWIDVAVLQQTGAPSLSLAGATELEALRRGISTWHCSISHEGDLAACVVIGLTERAFA